VTRQFAHPIPERLAPGVMVSSRRHEPRYRMAEVLFSDRSWRPCTLVAWARCRAGWAALVRWPDGSDGWYVYSARHVRPAAGR
jgi:hypothetical protein